jgi:hypothetical protein
LRHDSAGFGMVDSGLHSAVPREMRLARGGGVADHTADDARARLGLQEGDDRKDAPMGIGGDRQSQLLEDARNVLLHAPLGQEHTRGDRRVRKTPAIAAARPPAQAVVCMTIAQCLLVA